MLKVDGVDNWYDRFGEIRWWVEGDTTAVDALNIQPNSNQSGEKFANLTVSANATGFVLCAEYTRYTGWGGSPVEYKVTARRYVAVATGMEIADTVPEKLKVGNSYPLKIKVIMDCIKGDNNNYQHYTSAQSDYGNGDGSSEHYTKIVWNGLTQKGDYVDMKPKEDSLGWTIMGIKMNFGSDEIIAKLNRMKEIVDDHINPDEHTEFSVSKNLKCE